MGAFAGSFSVNFAKAQETEAVSSGTDDATCIAAVREKLGINNPNLSMSEYDLVATHLRFSTNNLWGDAYIACRLTDPSILNGISLTKENR